LNDCFGNPGSARHTVRSPREAASGEDVLPSQDVFLAFALGVVGCGEAGEAQDKREDDCKLAFHGVLLKTDG
jgi:hypothetical protein